MKKSLMILTIIFSLFLTSSCSFEDNTVTLKTAVSHDGSQLTIENKDYFDYKKATITINNSYTLDVDELKSSETYTVGMMQFADSDGNRFNPFSQKPQSLTISCKVQGDKDGFVYANW